MYNAIVYVDNGLSGALNKKGKSSHPLSIGFTLDSDFSKVTSDYQDAYFRTGNSITETIREYVNFFNGTKNVKARDESNRIKAYNLSQNIYIFPNNEYKTASGNAYIRVSIQADMSRGDNDRWHLSAIVNTALYYGSTNVYFGSSSYGYDTGVEKPQFGLYAFTGSQTYSVNQVDVDRIQSMFFTACQIKPFFLTTYKSLNYLDNELSTTTIATIENSENPYQYYIQNYFVTDVESYFIPINKDTSATDTRFRNSTQVRQIRLNTNSINWWTKFFTSAKPYESNATDSPIDITSDGDRDNTSDEIVVPDLPTINIFGSGLITAYNLNETKLNELSRFLWSDSFYDNILKNLNNPLDSIISLQTMPINLEDYSIPSNDLVIGAVSSGITGVNKLINQYIQLDFGTVDVNEYYGSFQDYFSTISIYLPYVGKYTLNTMEVMNSTLHLYYNIDILSGNCVAIVDVSKNRYGTSYKGATYSFNGNIATHLPITGSQKADLLKVISSSVGLVTSVASGNVGGVANAVSNVSHDLLGRENQVNGSMGLNYGSLNVRTPFIIYENKIEDVPIGFAHSKGFIFNRRERLGNMSGFTVISDIEPNYTGMLKEEKELLKSTLAQGIVI